MKPKLYQINISEQIQPNIITLSGFPDTFWLENPDGTYQKESETIYRKTENELYHYIEFISPNWRIITAFDPDFYSSNLISSQWRDFSTDEIVSGETTSTEQEEENHIIASIDLNIDNPNSLTLNYLQDAELQYHHTIDFNIELIDSSVTSVNTEKSFKFKSKTDITSTSPNQKIVTDIGKDVGKKEYINASPHKPFENNPDFIEIT
jgi:hypothetical protein